jgi:hypothetical protein
MSDDPQRANRRDELTRRLALLHLRSEREAKSVHELVAGRATVDVRRRFSRLARRLAIAGIVHRTPRRSAR